MAEFGTDWDIINVDITGVSDIELTYTKPVKSFVLWSRNRKTWLWRRTNGATLYASIFGGNNAKAEVQLNNASASSASLGFARPSDGTADTIEGIVTF